MYYKMILTYTGMYTHGQLCSQNDGILFTEMHVNNKQVRLSFTDMHISKFVNLFRISVV